jgi:mannose-1-phosphate guanylyltransferase
MFRAGLLLDEYQRFEPGTLVESVERAGRDLGFVILDSRSFSRAAAKSIDYTVMERTKNAAVIPVSYVASVFRSSASW